MSVSGETLFSVLVGGLISGLITWAVAERYFRKQDVRAEESFTILARFLESFANIVNQGGQPQVGFTRDAVGRITNAHVSMQLKAAIGPTGTLYPPVIQSAPPTRNNTEPTSGSTL